METAFDCPWQMRGWSAHPESRRPTFSVLLSLRWVKAISCSLQGSSPASGLDTSMGTGHSLPLFSKQNDSTDKKQASEGQREKHSRKCFPVSFTIATFSCRNEALAPEEFIYFQPMLYRTNYSEKKIPKQTPKNCSCYLMKYWSLHWHLLTLNGKRTLGAVYIHSSCENN